MTGSSAHSTSEHVVGYKKTDAKEEDTAATPVGTIAAVRFPGPTFVFLDLWEVWEPTLSVLLAQTFWILNHAETGFWLMKLR